MTVTSLCCPSHGRDLPTGVERVAFLWIPSGHEVAAKIEHERTRQEEREETRESEGPCEEGLPDEEEVWVAAEQHRNDARHEAEEDQERNRVELTTFRETVCALEQRKAGGP